MGLGLTDCKTHFANIAVWTEPSPSLVSWHSWIPLDLDLTSKELRADQRGKSIRQGHAFSRKFPDLGEEAWEMEVPLLTGP